MNNPLDSKKKRYALAPRREPYWVRLQTGGFVGYRKMTEGEGTWIGRWRDDEGKQHYRSLGHFERYDDAKKAADKWIKQNEQGANPTATTVEEACKAYVESLELDKRLATATDAKGRFRRLVYETRFGRIQLDKLKTTDLRRWLSKQVDQGEDDDDEDMRRAKDSANRNLASLKAALNRALKDRLVATDSGWKTVEAFKKVGKRRANAFIPLAERHQLLEKCPDDLRQFVKAMLLTGSRPGELAALNACDFNKKLRTLTLRGKTGERTVAISTEAAAFFAEITKNRIGNVAMFLRADGGRWDKDSWKDVFKDAVNAAGLSGGVVMYSLRHTAISEMIMAGLDSFLVAKLTGTSVAMIESNYGHLKHEHVREKLDAVKIV